MADYEIEAEVAVEEVLFEEDVNLALEGPPGKSAYEVAVDEGFEGTVEEWLASLVGGDLEDDTLGVLDPDKIAETITAWGGMLGSPQEVIDGTIGFMTSIITDQPATPQVALQSAALILALLVVQNGKATVAYDHALLTSGNPHGLTLADLGAAAAARSITAGTGLAGGGNLSADRTLSIDPTVLAKIGDYVEAPGDLTRSSTTVLADDTLVRSGVATKYLLDGYITFTGDTTADVKIGITIPGGTMRVTIQHALNSVASTSSGDYDRFTNLTTSGATAVHGTAGTSTPSSARISGWVKLNTPGNISVVWGTSGAGSATREAESYFGIRTLPHFS